MILKKILTIIGQLITVLLFLLLGFILIDMNIPGNGAICDTEEIMLFGTWFIFIILALGIIVNSWIFYKKEKWKSYRIGLIIITSTILFFSITLRQIIIATYYGKEKKVIEAKKPSLIKIQLFENGKFFAKTYNTSCESENTGTYNLTNNRLILSFKYNKSEYLGTKYSITNNIVTCLDCEEKYELKMK